MMLPSVAVYKTLKANGVKYIHHANSVITSCQFLRAGALLSRGTAKRKGLHQTPQYSDDTDRNKSVWFDVFADSVDIHNRASRSNKYGPVLFVLDLEIIKKSYTGGIWVTKLNPTKWQGIEPNDRWFTSTKEFESKFRAGQFDQMIVFRHCGGELPFRKYLKKVVLDDPKLVSKEPSIDYYSMAYGALQLAMAEGGMDVRIEKRECNDGCKCVREYKAKPYHTQSMYIPSLKSDKNLLPVARRSE